MGGGPGSRTASALVVRVDRLDGVMAPERVVPQVEQSCGKIPKWTGRSGHCPPCGPTTSGQQIRHAGRASL